MWNGNYVYTQTKIEVGHRVAYHNYDIWFGTVAEVHQAHVMIKPDPHPGNPYRGDGRLEQVKDNYKITKIPDTWKNTG